MCVSALASARACDLALKYDDRQVECVCVYCNDMVFYVSCNIYMTVFIV